MMFKWCVLALACSVASALSVKEAKDSIISMKNAGVEEHGKLQASIVDFGEIITRLQEGSDNFIREAEAMDEKACSEGAAVGAASIAKGSLCAAEALTKGVADQAFNQVNCFKVMGEYVAKFSLLGVEVAKSALNPSKAAEIVREASIEEMKEMDLVHQKLNHVTLLQRTLMDDVGSCLRGVLGGLQTSRSLCGESPIDPVDLLFPETEEH